MKLLYELEQMSDAINITENQKTVLLICAVSATSVQAYEMTTGHQELISARNSLTTFNYINVFNNEISLTEKGNQALTDFNLIDEMGNPTDTGKELLNDFFPQIPSEKQ